MELQKESEGRVVCASDNLLSWMGDHPERFARRINPMYLSLYGGGAVICLCLLFFPSIIPVSPSWIIRAAAAFCALVCAGFAYTEGYEFYNLESGGTMRDRATKKFDNSLVKRSQLLDALDRRDFDFLLDAPDAENQPVQLEIYEDAAGKVFFLLLYSYSGAVRRPVSEVVEVSGAEYDRWMGVIRSIKSTD